MLPNRYWSDQSPSLLSSIRVCKLLSVASTSTQPLVITHCVTVNSDLQWTLFVYNHQVTPSSCRALKSIPSKLSKDSLYTLLHLVDQLHVCPGHPEKHFIEFVLSRKGVLKSHDGSISAILDDYAPVSLNGITYSCTIRTGKCEHLVHEVKCLSCQRYRSTLRSAYSRFMRRQPDRVSDTGSHVNIRYMTTPEKRCKMRKMMLRTQEAEQEIKKLRRKIAQLTYKHGEAVELDLHNELLNVMKQKTKDVLDAYPEGSFTRLFWEEQLRAAKASDPRQMRWHPLIVRWCLNLKLLSSAAYHAARTAGFIKLPSERTLRDYTHYFKHRPGFQQEVNQQLMKESKVHDLPEEQKYCGIIFDEMKVKENLVYDKYTGSVIGFINIGQINNDLLALEQEFKRDGAHAPIANHLLVLMVRGIFFKLEFPLAHFATTGVTADQLFPIIWEGVRQVESVGLKVLFITADGASANRKFFRMHRNSNDACMSNVPTYKTQNPFAQEQRPIFFISDPSHLMKTTRNCWSHSAFSGTRLMTVSLY